MSSMTYSPVPGLLQIVGSFGEMPTYLTIIKKGGLKMKTLKIDEYLVVNLYTQKRRWLTVLPRKLQAYDVVVRIRGTVKVPDMLPIIELGEITIPEIEAMAQAEMG